MNIRPHLVVAGVLLGLLMILSLAGCKSDETSDTATLASSVPIVNSTTTTKAAPLTDDQRYTGLLNEYGVYFSSETAAVEMADTICETVTDYGKDTTLEILTSAMSEADYPYTPRDMQNLMSSAIVIYCPQFN